MLHIHSTQSHFIKVCSGCYGATRELPGSRPVIHTQLVYYDYLETLLKRQLYHILHSLPTSQIKFMMRRFFRKEAF